MSITDGFHVGYIANRESDVRCDMRDAKIAVETGVDGLDVVIGTSSFLREHSHGKDMAYIEKTAIEVIEYIKSKGLEVRCESLPYPSFSPCPCFT